MKTCKFILLFVLLVSCWNCAEPELGIEEEILFDAELNLLPENVTVADLLRDNSPEEFKQATGKILGNTLGRRLLLRVKSIPNRPLIYFWPIMDKDGNLVMGVDGELRYYGMGRIDYNEKILRDANRDELLFHEFFHFFQNGNLLPNRNLNNEVEAYVAQYCCKNYKINTWREDKFERSVANGTETVFVTLRFCVVRKQLKATLKPNAAGVQLPPHYYRNG